MTVGFYTFQKYHNREPESIGSSRIRGRWVWESWSEAEEWQIGKKYDVVIFQKVYQYEYAKRIKAIKILDMCDPDWLEGANVVQMIEACDVVTTSTESLNKYIKTITKKPVFTVPDRIKINEHKPRKDKHKGRAKKVVWFGYGQNHVYLDQTIDVLKNKGLKLMVISNVPYQPNFTFNYTVENIKFDYTNFNFNFIKNDIAILPAPFGERGKFKSNNKDLISWALGLPVAKSPEDIDKFINADNRNEEIEKKNKLLKEKYLVDLSVKQYQDIIKEISK